MSEAPLRPVDLLPIADEYLETFWPIARPMVEKGCAHNGEWTADEIEAGIRDGRFQLWVLWQSEPPAVLAAAATRVLTFATGIKKGDVVVMGGEGLAEILKYRDRLEDAFRKAGCSVLRVEGRQGWARHFKDYTLKSIVLEKVLT